MKTKEQLAGEYATGTTFTDETQSDEALIPNMRFMAFLAGYDAANEQPAAARLERVVERFERLSAATMGAADCMELDLPKLWKLAERIETFIEQKRAGHES